MNLKIALLAASFAFASLTASEADAQTQKSGTSEIAPATAEELQLSIKTAMQRISASPYANATLIEAVNARYEGAVRLMLVQNGVDANALAAVAIDVNGAEMGPREALPQTIYFAVSTATTNSGTPVGLIFMGRPFGVNGWVDWNTFNPWVYF